MAGSTKVFSLCSLLMASLFAYSASVQLNDPDWYFWFPLYACACVVNLMNWANSPRRGMVILVAFSFALPFIFYVVKNGEMKFE